MARTLMITGASGQLGRLVVDALIRRGGDDRLVAGTREPSNLAALADRGVEVRKVDFDDERGMTEAFRGVDRLLVISGSSVTPGVRAAQHGRAVRAAAEAGVGHLVYTSFTNPSPASVVQVAADHAATEQALADSGVPFTSLRNNLYADFLLDALQQAAASGAWHTARGDAAAAYVTRGDCARAAVAALVDRSEETRALEITGPEALTGDEIASLASELRGEPIRHVPLSEEAWGAALEQAGLPTPVIQLLLSFERGIARGELAAVGDGFERLGIEPASSLRDFLRERLPR